MRALIISLFQSTLPHGSDTAPAVRHVAIVYFNPRSLTGATLSGKRSTSSQSNFNPRSLTGATFLRHIIYSKIIFQSTLPHGSDIRTCYWQHRLWISIHAPSRERRVLDNAGFNHQPISIHAPSRERHSACSAACSYSIFQSTLPHGSDLASGFSPFSDSIFQSTLPHGSDQRLRSRFACTMKFQSTLPHGSDHNEFLSVHILQHFNPRSLTGATIARIVVAAITHISIHAPSRERRNIGQLIIISRTFQSTLPHGSDSPLIFCACASGISIHAPSRERRLACLQWHCAVIFQSTLPHGSDHNQYNHHNADV